jgi:hypothetical protein
LIQPALLGGVFIGVLSALPVVNFANCCCLWIVCGGMLAAYLDTAPLHQRTPLRGALDGVLAGAVGAFVWVFASMAIDVVFGPIQERFLQFMLENATDMPPDSRAWLEAMAESGRGPFRFVFGFMFQMVIGVVFGALGGLLGAAFFWRDNAPPALGGPVQPPPIPPEL